jgi:hypothetical protein
MSQVPQENKMGKTAERRLSAFQMTLICLEGIGQSGSMSTVPV